MKLYTLYMLRNVVTDMKYIGVTSNYDVRMSQHKTSTANNHISRSIRKHGWDNFEKKILQTDIPEKDAFDLEARTIQALGTYTNGYNETIGENYQTPRNWKRVREIWDQQEDIVHLHKHLEFSITAIADKFNCSWYLISDILIDAGYKPTKLGRPQRNYSHLYENPRLVIDAYLKDKLSLEKVGRIFDADADGIRKLLVKYRIKLRKSTKSSQVWHYEKEIVKDRKLGLTHRALVAKYNSTKGAINSVLKENGLVA